VNRLIKVFLHLGNVNLLTKLSPAHLTQGIERRRMSHPSDKPFKRDTYNKVWFWRTVVDKKEKEDADLGSISNKYR